MQPYVYTVQLYYVCSYIMYIISISQRVCANFCISSQLRPIFMAKSVVENEGPYSGSLGGVSGRQRWQHLTRNTLVPFCRRRDCLR